MTIFLFQNQISSVKIYYFDIFCILLLKASVICCQRYKRSVHWACCSQMFAVCVLDINMKHTCVQVWVGSKSVYPDFTILPVEGYIEHGMDVKFTSKSGQQHCKIWGMIITLHTRVILDFVGGSIVSCLFFMHRICNSRYANIFQTFNDDYEWKLTVLVD